MKAISLRRPKLTRLANTDFCTFLQVIKKQALEGQTINIIYKTLGDLHQIEIFLL